ncbi:acyl-CoA dehydrogenase family protein [Mumia xiangluensis]|uniref:Acyl-CoA dehydrogenase family protein n=1 Tax=Mumia xiangluensis TaxID=1678900 RepID=A0ABW1QKH7_9ACTN
MSTTTASRVHTDPSRWRDLVDSDERAEFAASVRAHLGARFGPDAARACFDAAQPAEAWREIAAADYPVIGLPEAMGGAGSIVDAVAMVEAAGPALVPLPLVSTVTAWQTVAHAGRPSEGRAYEVSSERRAALAVVDGTDELVVLDGALADEVVLVDVRGAAVRVSVADVSDAVTAVHRHVDPGRPTAVLDRTRLSETVLADGRTDVDAVLAPARTVLAADLTGVGATALDRAVRHALEREQFGKRIGAFQGIKHRLADVYVAVERARSLTRAAAVALASDGTSDLSAAELALLAKAAATDAAVDSTRAYVQVLGAMGMTFEADAHLYFRRAQQTAPFLGSAADCYRAAALVRREDHR